MAENDPQTPRSVKSQPAVREVGYATMPTAGGSWWRVDLNDDEAPELRWPYCLPVYDAMYRQDAQVRSVLRAVSHPIRRTPARVDPNGAPPEVVAFVAQNLGLPVMGAKRVPPLRTRDSFSWAEHLRMVLLKLRYGHMAFEQVYRYDEATDRLLLRKLGPRMPRTIAKFNVARDGGLISLEQKSAPGSTVPITLPVSRLVMHVHEREGGQWWGESLLRPAYKNWLIKDRLLRTNATTIDRNGMGVPVYTAGDKSEPLGKGQELASDLRSGEDAGAAIPNGAELKLMGVDGDIPDALPSVKYHDEQIARAVLAHFLNLGTATGTGSYALSSNLGDFFTESLQAEADDIADVTTRHVVEDLVDLNFGPDVPAPRVVFDEIGSQTAALALAIKSLVDAGVLTADEGLEAHIRLGLGLPARDTATARPAGEDSAA